MSDLILGKPAKITAGVMSGHVGILESVSKTLGLATIQLEKQVTVSVPVDYVDQEIDPNEGYHEWLSGLPAASDWLDYQIGEYNARFDGINLLDAYLDDDYKTLVMLRNTKAEIQRLNENVEYFRKEAERLKDKISWAKYPDRMGQ